MLRVLSLGAGVQSSTVLLMSCRGELPKLDAAVFADTHAEPAEVYTHLGWLMEVAHTAGIPVHVVSHGDLRNDALSFFRNRKSEDGKRRASLPVFVRRDDGEAGQVDRQCTSDYKIEPLEKYVKQTLLGIPKGKPAPKVPMVEIWMGISADEPRRASAPGRWEKGKPIKVNGKPLVDIDLWGEPLPKAAKVWKPAGWKVHVYPLINLRIGSDRKQADVAMLPRPMTREDCKQWLRQNYPERAVPRSACVFCPYRDNAGWKRMRDSAPTDWDSAVEFDRQARVAFADGVRAGHYRNIVGQPFIHRQLVPLDMVDLDGNGYRGESGCGTLYDGMDGLCGV